jgi:hypothetical protein
MAYRPILRFQPSDNVAHHDNTPHDNAPHDNTPHDNAPYSVHR